MHALLREVTPLVEPVGLDEAYLDVAGSHRLLGTSVEIADALHRQIATELRLPCSVGVGRTKLVAKLASRAAKPRSSSGSFPGVRRAAAATSPVVAVEPAAELEFLHRHPVRALPGVGPRTAERLRRFGVSTIGDLATVPAESLERLLGAAHGSALHALSRGVDDRPVVADRALKSIGHEQTFEQDVREISDLARRARTMAAGVSSACRRSGVVGRTVTLKLKYGDFSLQTRARTLPAPTDDGAVIGDAAAELLASAPLRGGVRLLGVAVSSLSEPADGPEQLELFTGAQAARPNLGRAADSVRARFGSGALTSASALQERIVQGGGGAR
jgi:DNA polymerase-4